MAVLGNRGTGILDMLIEGFRRSGQNMEQPNMSQVAPTPLQRAMNQPVSRLTSTGDVGTIYPDGRVAQQTSVPLLQNLSRGRVLNPINPMQDMGEPMIVSEALRKEAVAEALNRPEYGQLVEARQAEQQPQATPDVMGMQKLAEDAAKVQKAINDNPQLEQDPTFMDKVKGYFGNRENMAKLALAFNSMRLSPDAGLAASLGQELKDIRATRADEELRNRTAAYFAKTDPKIAAAMQAGLSARDAIALSQDKNKGVVVGKMIVNPRTGDIIYDGSKEGSDLPDSVQKIIWGAKQLNLTPGSEKYQEYVASQLKGKSQTITLDKDGNLVITEGTGGGSLGKQNEGQSKALAFGTRMAVSQDTINAFETEGTSIRNALAQQVPFGGNFISTPEFKLYDQAKRDFVNALLRWESGAAIGPAEFRSADLQYFPQPGDTPDVIENKRRNRDVMIKVMQSVAGGGDDAAVKDYIKGVKVEIFGAKAANWPDTGEIKVDKDTGDQYVFKGGDPNIESNWVKK